MVLTRFARLDPVTMETGLFCLRPRVAEKEKATFLVTHRHGARRYQYEAPYALDHVALRVLLALCALAAMSQQPVSAAPSQEGFQAGRARLNPEPEACQLITGSWTGPLAMLTREAGMTTAGSNLARVRQRLQELAKVRVTVFDADTDSLIGAAQLISFLSERDSNRVLITLGPWLSKAVLPSLKGQYVPICLETLRQIKDPAGQILHAVFSSRIRERRTTPVRYGVNAVAAIPYAKAATAGERSSATQRKRRAGARRAMQALAAVGWRIEPVPATKGGCYDILRRPPPAMPAPPQTRLAPARRKSPVRASAV